MTQLAQKKPGMSWGQVAQVTGYSVAELAMIRSSVAPRDCTPEEMAVFLASSNEQKLRPLRREVYLVRQVKNGPAVMMTGIDGFRARAGRCGDYAGSEDPAFRGLIQFKDGDRTIKAPEIATVTVWRLVGGHKCAFTASVRWEEFYPGAGERGAQYRKRPYHMLGVRAESHALRKAFASEMAGMPELIEAPTTEVIEQPQTDRQQLSDTYRRIYDAEEQWFESTEPPAEAPTDNGPDDDDPDPDEIAEEAERSQQWQKHRELTGKAQELKLRVPTVRNTAGVAELRAANAELERRISEKDQAP